MVNTEALVVRGGIVFARGGRVSCDVLLSEGKIAALEAHGTDFGQVKCLDASGLYVLPGMVDTHVHLMEPGDVSREDFSSGTKAAAANGVTTILEHTHAWPVTTPERLREKMELVKGHSFVDFGLAAHLWDDNLNAVEELWNAGVSFFKVFTCATHGVPFASTFYLWEAFKKFASVGATTLVHCEDDSMTSGMEAMLRDAGRSDGDVVPLWRFREAEQVAVSVVVTMARVTGAKVAIAHASSPEVLETVREGRLRGAAVVAESCPQYLYLWEDEVRREGPLRKFTPPARIRSVKEGAAMWSALRSGQIHHLATDHAPSTRSQKAHGIWDAPFGLPGLDTTLPLMLSAALSGRVSLERLVEVCASAPARWYGLGQKGELRVGGDADLVLVDPDGVTELSDERVISKAAWSPYAGVKLRGAIVRVLLRGSVIYENGGVGAVPQGKWIPGPGFR